MILFLHHRCGSQATMDLLWGDRKAIQAPVFSIPPILSRKFIYGTDSLEKIAATPNILWTVYIGHWWGDISAKIVPDTEVAELTNMWRPSELQKLGPMPIATIIRNGRNQIESLRLIKGGVEENRHKKDPDDWFEFCCKAWRNRAHWCSSCSSKLPNFEIFRFEDFYENPTAFIKDLFLFFHLKPNDEKIAEAKSRTFGDDQIKDSTFGSLFHMNSRSRNWTAEQERKFKEICSTAMEALGYA